MTGSAYDLIVIGGGPAGCAAAIIAARRGHKVLLLEAGKLPRHRVCGEFISPEATSPLEWLLVDSPLLKTAPRIRKTRLFGDGHEATIPLDPPALSIPRYALDAALWDSALRAGAEGRQDCRVLSVCRKAEQFAVELPGETVLGRAVIDASGRWSNLNKLDEIPEPRRIGIKAHFREPVPGATCDLYFFAGGYCGVQPVGYGVVNASALVRADVARTLEDVFAKHPALHERSRTWTQVTERVTTSPLVFRDPALSDNGVLKAGDAAAFIDPFAGDGISMALHSGQLAAEALHWFLAGLCSREQAIADYEQRWGAAARRAVGAAAGLRMLLTAPEAIRAVAWRALRLPFIARVAASSTRVRAPDTTFSSVRRLSR